MGCGCNKKKNSTNHGADGTTKVRLANGVTRTYASRRDAELAVEQNPGAKFVK